MKLIKKKKGFTLVEMMITITILFIVMGIIFPLFNSNLKTLNETETRSDLQREGQQAMKYFTDKAMEAQKVVLLKNDKDKVIISTERGIRLEDTEVNMKEIEFFTDSVQGNPPGNIIHKFYLEKQSDNFYQLKYVREILEDDGKKIQGGSDVVIANNIESIKVTTKDNGQPKKFDECKSLNVKINLSKKTMPYSVESQVFFRNGVTH